MVDFAYVAGGLSFPSGIVSYIDGSLIVSEMAKGVISRVTLDGQVTHVADCGGGPEGISFGLDGRLYICNNGGSSWTEVDGDQVPGDQAENYIGGCIQVFDPDTLKLEVLYRQANGFKLRGPSDLVFDDAGGFWFTDRGKTRARQRDRGGLFYAAVDGSEIKEVVYPLDAPSGVALSAAGDELYVAESNQGRVYKWGLSGPGEIAGYFGSMHRGELLADPEGGIILNSLTLVGTDRICAGSSGRSGIVNFTPDGIHYLTKLDENIVSGICVLESDPSKAYVTLSGSGFVAEIPWDTY